MKRKEPTKRLMMISTIFMKLAISFFHLSATSSHLQPLQVDNFDSNSRLVVHGWYDNDKFRLEWVRDWKFVMYGIVLYVFSEVVCLMVGFIVIYTALVQRKAPFFCRCLDGSWVTCRPWPTCTFYVVIPPLIQSCLSMALGYSVLWQFNSHKSSLDLCIHHL